jgi:hypothetical protein
MADTVVAASLTLDANQANQSVASFKKELKTANGELLLMQKQFGETSKEALAAAKKVATLKDAIGDAKEVTALFDPGAKFQAFGNVVKGVAGGITALTGTMALFGGESKEVEKILLKVQGAMALSQGLSTITDAAKDFKRLNAVIQQSAVFQKANAIATTLAAGAMKLLGVAANTTSTMFKVLKGAIAATGIGLLVVAIGFLVDKIMDWVSSTDTAEAAQERLNKSIEKVNESLDKNLRKIDFNTKKQLLLAKEAGKSEEELQKLKEQGFQKELTQLKVAENQKVELANRAIKEGKLEVEKLNEIRKDALDAQKASDEKNKQLQLSRLEFSAAQADKARDKQKQLNEKAIADAKAAADKRTEVEKAAQDQLDKLREDNFLSSIEDARKRQVTEVQFQFESEQSRIKALKLSAEKEAEILAELAIQRTSKIFEIDKKIAQERAEAEREAQENLLKVRQENTLAAIEDESARAEQKAQFDFENTKKEIEALKVSEDTKTQLIIEAEIVRNNAIAELDKAEKQKQDELKLELDEMQLDELALKNQQLDAWYKEKLKIVGDNEQLQTELTAAYEAQRTALQQQAATQRLNIVSSTLGKAAELFGKQTAAGKVLAIAEATINTYTGATLALREKSLLPQPFSTIQKIVSVGLIIGAGLKSIKEIVKTKVPGGGGGSVPSLSVSAAAPLSPTPQVGTTQLDQTSLSAVGNATVRAFVVESDVTNNQERITRLNRASRLG